jgi:hypothetical protein
VPWRSDDLVAAVRLRCRIPDGGSVASDEEILLLADEELSHTILPAVRRARAEFYVGQADYAVDGSTGEFRIPSRAQSGGLRDVVMVGADGTGVSLPMVSLERRDTYHVASHPHWPNGYAFAVQGDKVILLPSAAPVPWTLRLRYYQRPGRLVPAAQGRAITAIDGDGVTYTCAATGTSGIVAGVSVDLIQAQPNFDWLATGVTIATEAPNDIVLPAAVPGVTVGDVFTLAGTTVMVQLPEALHPTLVNAVAMRVYELLGNHQQAEAVQKRLERTLGNVQSLINPRIEGEAQALINRHSPLRTGRWR